MISYSLFCFLVLGVLGLYQLVLTILFYLLTRPRKTTWIEDSDYPPVSILLALRGADPELADSLEQIMQQDYPSYDVRLVIDSESDPAWPVVENAVRSTGAEHVTYAPLAHRPDNSSLHCASLVQLAEGLDGEDGLFVLVDSDVNPHPTWLRDLVRPIVLGEADATTGNRWYMPPEGRAGSLVRYIWNAAALISMHWYRVPWGGTFAARKSDLFRSGIVDRWRRALAVDAPIFESWRKIGLKSTFVPSLIMINREEIAFAANFTFVSRQLLWTRLYQPVAFWWAIVVHGLVTSTACAAALGLAFWNLSRGDRLAAITAGAGAISYWMAMFISLSISELRVRQGASAQGKEISWLTPSKLLQLLALVPITQYLHAVAVVKVLFQTSIDWRGVTYQIKSPFDVRLAHDRGDHGPSDSLTSV